MMGDLAILGFDRVEEDWHMHAYRKPEASNMNSYLYFSCQLSLLLKHFITW